MRNRIYAISCLVAMFMMMGICIRDSFGSGFGIFTQDSSSTAQASATIAHTYNPSAIFYNPALINQLPGTQIEAGTTLILPSREFKSSLTGQTTKTEHETFFPSNFYVTHAVNDKLSVGLGIFNPFGIGTKWPNEWEGRYLATNSQLTTLAFNPVASIRLFPWLTVAGGVTYLTLDTTLERKLAFFPFPDGSQRFKGSGDGLGFNLGVLVEPSKDINIGLSYRSSIDVSINGHADFGFPAALTQIVGPASQTTVATTKLVLPAQAYAGIYFKQLYPLTIEIATRWEQWSKFRELNLQFTQPIAGSTGVVQERNWRNTWTEMIGLGYQLNDTISLLGGYLYQRGAVPDSTFEPAIPDANSHLFSAGANIRLKSVTIGAAYAYQILQSHEKNNMVDDNPADGVLNPFTAANGTYKSHLNIFSLNLTYRF